MSLGAAMFPGNYRRILHWGLGAVQCGEVLLQQDSARIDSEEKPHSLSDRASGRDWFQMENCLSRQDSI